MTAPDFVSIDKKIYTSVVWDPAVEPTPTGDQNFFHPIAIKGDDGKVFDFFCGGDSFLADGRLLSAGGTLAYPGHVFGRADAVLFNPTTQLWARAGHMAHGRWYPTLVTLGDGRRILAVSGLNEDGNLNQTIEPGWLGNAGCWGSDCRTMSVSLKQQKGSRHCVHAPSCPPRCNTVGQGQSVRGYSALRITEPGGKRRWIS